MYVDILCQKLLNESDSVVLYKTIQCNYCELSGKIYTKS